MSAFLKIFSMKTVLCVECVLTLLLARHEWAAESFVISNKFLSPDNCLWVIVFIKWGQEIDQH